MVFDLDATLADLSSVYYFLAVLTQHKPLQKNQFLIEPLDPMMPKAYDYFVQRIVQEETETRLGLLRPGILEMMGALYRLKKEQKIQGVLIYSNNSHLESVYFVRDVIHVYYPRLISDCIHWMHPKRNTDRIAYNQSNGRISKTWATLKDIMINGPTKASPFLEPSEVHFFDDLMHRDLKRALDKTYHQIEPYVFKASFDRLAHLFLSSLSYAEVNMYELENNLVEMYPDVRNPFIFQNFNKGNTTRIEDILDLFYHYGGEVHTRLPPLDSLEIAEVILEVEQTNKKGGKYKKKKKKSYTYKLHRKTIRRL